MLLAAAGAPEEQIFQILGTILSDVVMVLVDLVPCIIIMIDGMIDLGFDLSRCHAFQVLHCEQLVILHLYKTHPVTKVILGADKLAAPDHAEVDRHLVVLEQLACAQGHRLVSAGNGAHTLRENAHAMAGLDDPADFLHRVKIRRKILLGNHPKQIDHQRQMGTVELVIACHEIHLQRQQRCAHEDVV